MIYYLIRQLQTKSKKNSGFTLIELLVVIIIIGILSAIALPSFLSQSNKGRQAEAKTYLSSLASAEQQYFLHKNQFVTDIKMFGKLNVGLPINSQNNYSTSNYAYLLAPTAIDANGNAGAVVITATPLNSAPYHSYLAAVGLIYQDGASEPTTISTQCQSKGVGANTTLGTSDITVTPGTPLTGGGSITCSNSSEPVTQGE